MVLNIRTNILLLFFILQSVLPVLAEQYYYFKQISLSEGLSGSMVKCVLTDHKGLMWIGTNFGLNSFDRESVRNYYQNKNDPNSLPSNDICFLIEDSLLNLWVATEQGLTLYDRDKDYFVPVVQGTSMLNIHAYVFIQGGILFFGKNEVYKYDYKRKKIILQPLHATEQNVAFFDKACMETDDTVILSCRWNGLWRYHIKTGVLERALFNNDLQITALFMDTSGCLWVSSYGQGLVGYKRNGQVRCHLRVPEQLTNGVILDIQQRDGQLWLATDGGGINIYDLEKGTIHTLEHLSGKQYSLPVNSFRCLYNDPDSNMWAGSIRGGLIGIKEIYMKTYRDAPLNSIYGLSDKTVIGMYEDDDGFIWLGTDGGGMNRFDPKTQLFRHYPSTYFMKIVSIIAFDKQHLLVSLFGTGLYLFNKQTGAIKEYPVLRGTWNDRMFCAGKSVHLSRLNEESFYLFADSVYLYNQSEKKLANIPAEEDSLTVSSPSLIWNDREKSYLRTWNDIILLDYQKNVIKSVFRSKSSIGAISAACWDENGYFWIGNTTGLYSYDPVAEKLDTVETDRFQGVNSLRTDHSGRLWVGTYNALYAYTPEDKRIVAFGESDGVYANEYISKLPLITRSGDLYMAGTMGLVYIRKDVPIPPNSDPSIQLLEVMLNGAPMGSSVRGAEPAISIPWNYTSLSAKVIVRENDLMRKKLFRYYIKGVHEEMRESSSYSIAFHSLSAGSYEVWVSCNKKNGDWSTPVKILSITITPPWWKSSWFMYCSILFFLIVVGVILWLIIRNKENKMIWAMKEHEKKMYEEKIKFLINVSHELRTPLTLIYAPLKRLLESGEIAAPNHIRLLSDIFKQTRRINDIINMVLNVRKMEVGAEILDIREYNLNDWIQSIAEDFRNELIFKGVQLSYELDATLGTVSFDASKCEIVLSNLLMNALKFSDSETCITLSSRADGSNVRISVSDQGIGLKGVDVSKLFTSFYQGEHARKGSGIGLSYAQLLVEIHGGRMGAVSNEEKGATFFYELPVKNETSQIVSKPYLNELLDHHEQSTNLMIDLPIQKYSILIVEDEPELRNYLKEALNNSFNQIYLAEDGEEGLEMTLRYYPDLVVSDVIMPRMDGFELCKQIKSNIAISHIPVILLTAQSDPESTIQGYKLGADIYLTKPFDLEFLLTVIHNQLKNRKIIKLRYQEGLEVISAKEDTISNADEQFFQKLNALIGENIENPDLDVNFVASQMAMSRSSLYNKLKQLTDVSIGDYINKFRMTKALQLLADPALSILEVSEKAGFANQRYFSTAFKQVYNVTPSKYRQDHFS